MKSWAWRDKDIIRLEKLSKQFNAKRNAYARTHKGSGLYLPPTQHKNVKDFKNRKEFNTHLKQLERGTRKGAFAPIFSKGGEIATKWERDNARYLKQSVLMQQKALLEKNSKKYKKKQKDKKEAREKYLLGQTKFSTISLNDLKLGELKDFVKSLKLTESDINNIPQLDKKYKENYIKALLSNFPEADAHGIVNYLEEMSAEDVATAQYIDDFLSIENPYRYEDSEEYLEKLYIHWVRYNEK